MIVVYAIVLAALAPLVLGQAVLAGICRALVDNAAGIEAAP